MNALILVAFLGCIALSQGQSYGYGASQGYNQAGTSYGSGYGASQDYNQAGTNNGNGYGASQGYNQMRNSYGNGYGANQGNSQGYSTPTQQAPSYSNNVKPVDKDKDNDTTKPNDKDKDTQELLIRFFTELVNRLKRETTKTLAGNDGGMRGDSNSDDDEKDDGKDKPKAKPKNASIIDFFTDLINTLKRKNNNPKDDNSDDGDNDNGKDKPKTKPKNTSIVDFFTDLINALNKKSVKSLSSTFVGIRPTHIARISRPTLNDNDDDDSVNFNSPFNRMALLKTEYRQPSYQQSYKPTYQH
jgi:hypothetical protein